MDEAVEANAIKSQPVTESAAERAHRVSSVWQFTARTTTVLLSL